MSDGPGYEANLQRGQLLRERGRYQDACTYLGAAIQANPDQPQAYLELALAQCELPVQKREALQTIDRAVALAPNSDYYLGYKGYLLSHCGKHKEGLQVADHALKLNPFCYIALLAQANAYTKLAQWSAAERAARRILEIYAEDTSALNLLAQSLRFQDKLTESRAVLAQILARVPNDSFGQTNAGYEALKVGDYRRANEHFMHALRTDPHSDHARGGLLQSLRARIWIYRVNLKLLSAVAEGSDHSAILRVFFVILTVATGGIFLGFILLYLVLAFTLYPVSNLFLLLEPTGRRALTPRERNKAIFTGVCTAIVLTGLALIPCYPLFIFVAAYLSLFALGVYIPQWTDARRARRENKVLADTTTT